MLHGRRMATEVVVGKADGGYTFHTVWRRRRKVKRNKRENGVGLRENRENLHNE